MVVLETCFEVSRLDTRIRSFGQAENDLDGLETNPNRNRKLF